MDGQCTHLPIYIYQNYCTKRYSTVLHSPVLQCSVVHCTALPCIVFLCPVLNCTAPSCITLQQSVLHCTLLYCTRLFFIALYCTLLDFSEQHTEQCNNLHFTALHSTILHYSECMQCRAVCYFGERFTATILSKTQGTAKTNTTRRKFSLDRPSGRIQSISLIVCVSVCPLFEVLFKRLFVPTSRGPMSKLFRFSESLGKSNGKKILKLLIKNGLKLLRQTNLLALFGQFLFLKLQFCLGL
jgi:hypothetical protein